jgi:hypothetical protein
MRRITILLLLISSVSFSQTADTTKDQVKTETISIDFADLQKSSFKRKIRNGTIVELRINDVNRSQYDVQVNTNQANYFTNQPDVFSKLNPSEVDVTEKELNQESGASSFVSSDRTKKWEGEMKELSKNQEEFRQTLQEINEALENYKKNVAVIKQAFILNDVLTSISKDCSGKFDQLLSSANSAVIEFVNKSQIASTRPTGAAMAVLNAQIKAILSYHLEQAQNNELLIKEIFLKVDDQSEGLLESLQSVQARVKEDLAKKKEGSEEWAIINQLFRIGEKIRRSVKNDVKRVNDIIHSVELSSKFISDFSESNSIKALTDLYTSFNPGNFSVSYATIIQKDELVFDVKVTPKSDSKCANKNYDLPITVRTKGGFKLDFSTGIFLNFGKKDFFDQTYRVEDIEGDPDHVRIVRNKNRNHVQPSLGALLHAYFRTGGQLQPALSGGISIAASEATRVNYHSGVSLIGGKEQRLVATVGLTLAQASILDGKYEKDQMILKDGAPEDIPRTSYYRLGYFFSFTYNLTR